jgi:hypothetical protein
MTRTGRSGLRCAGIRCNERTSFLFAVALKRVRVAVTYLSPRVISDRVDEITPQNDVGSLIYSHPRPNHLRLMLSVSPAAALSLSLSLLPGLAKPFALLLVILNVRSLPLVWHCTWLLFFRSPSSRLLIIISEGVVLAPRKVVVAPGTCAHTRALLVSPERKRRAQDLPLPCAHRPKSARPHYSD